ncbi:MAG: DNA alkylation repair protein [Rhabdochlamydiaceae bacterium]
MNELFLTSLRSEMKNLISDPLKVSRFFKTEGSSYAAHDRFLGISVPNLRKIADKYLTLNPQNWIPLITSIYNEERLLSLIMMVTVFKKSDNEKKKDIYDFYREYLLFVNNWNLVDSSAPYILGAYLFDFPNNSLLWDLVKSENLWYRRIAIVSTLFFIKKNHLQPTLELAKELFDDKEDLIRKASGWMLREVGKKDLSTLLHFLKEHKKNMSKITYRYACERLSIENKIYIESDTS